MSATVVYVSYNISSLDLSWIPDSAAVIVVHNDASLDPATCRHDNITHLHPGSNIGFGAAVNLALRHADSDRIILCNPDTEMQREHFCALASGSPEEMTTVLMDDGAGRPTSMISPYWTPISLAAAAVRAGRLAPLGSARRRLLVPLLSRWGRKQQASMHRSEAVWPLKDYWCSGALISIDRHRLEAVGGFDDAFFLYYEDADLCRRLQSTFPEMVIRQLPCPPAVHAVGGTTTSGSPGSVVGRIRRRSAALYARRQEGLAWALVARWLEATHRGAPT